LGTYINHNCVTSVGPSSNSSADAVLAGQNIDKFSFALIAPLCAEHDINDATLAGAQLGSSICDGGRNSELEFIDWHKSFNSQIKLRNKFCTIHIVFLLLSKSNGQSLIKG